MKLLDCTLRDGGYYTQWDFDRPLTHAYLESINSLPVDYVEIGYRSKERKGYFGEYYYLPKNTLDHASSISKKKLAIMIDEKQVSERDIDQLISPCIGKISLIRIAVAPKNIQRAILLAAKIKDLGFEVGVNVMYMSTWKSQKGFFETLPEIKDGVDCFYMVDSHGGIFPDDIKEITDRIRSKVSVPLGFHGHNNLELALVNTLTALACGVEMVDSSIMGMGRGAGNLKTELLLSVLSAQGKRKFDFNPLSAVVDEFSKLQQIHGWGTNLPYMVSGANSIPQKIVMEWISKRYYSYDNIIQKLQKEDKGLQQKQHFKTFEPGFSTKQVLVVGGGVSISKHTKAINAFLKLNPNVLVIHTSSRNASFFIGIENQQLFCLGGNEGQRMERVLSGKIPKNAMAILPPSPREINIYIPDPILERTFELKTFTFSEVFQKSMTAVALEIGNVLQAEQLWVVGYDGYHSGDSSKNQLELFNENEHLFGQYLASGKKLDALTPTEYRSLDQKSVYSLI
ncbi:aldolase catalytic domain-containing protein [Pararhodonellum marinum]|uniref:aldolase catalytic domain-containing protein n=1 Tax=Pararhodonellum marinum TaxID=2755358 RepID=UPI00188EDA9A|nr:aldolase catalytic domain-containing protein [Pararhodonellum marinum]